MNEQDTNTLVNELGVNQFMRFLGYNWNEDTTCWDMGGFSIKHSEVVEAFRRYQQSSRKHNAKP